MKLKHSTKFKSKDSVCHHVLADYADSFIECLCHTKATCGRKPFELIDWQEQIIRDVFGMLTPQRLPAVQHGIYRNPKKDGKSELAAAVALLLTCSDGEERAKVYMVGCQPSAGHYRF